MIYSKPYSYEIGYIIKVSFIAIILLSSCQGKKINFASTDKTIQKIDSLNQVIKIRSDDTPFFIKQSDSLFKLSKAIGYEKGMAQAASQKINILRRRLQYDEALDFILKNQDTFNQFRDAENQISLFEELGILYFELDDSDQAFKYFNKVLLLLDNTENPKKTAQVFSHIGLLFMYNDYSKSIEYLQKSLDISTKINDSNGIARDLNNIAIQYLRRQSYDTAVSYFQRAMHINKLMGNSVYRATNLFNLANIENKKGRHEKAIRLYEKLEKTFDSLDQKKKHTKVFLNHADAYYSLKKFPNAIAYFTKSKDNAKKHKWSRIELQAYWGLYATYKSINNLDSAIYFLEQYHDLKGKRQKDQNLTEVARLEVKYKNDKLINQKVWSQQKQKILLYFIVTVLLFATTVLYQLIKKQKLKISKEKLERQLLQNELNSKERELTTFVLNMIRLNEKKHSIIDYLMTEKKRLKKENQGIIDKAIRDMEYHNDTQAWKEFEVRFNKVNSDFYVKLLKKFPDLTNNEKRLCAFLLMNMTTKEIASFTGQSIEAIGKARTRLRKKLGLKNREESITLLLSTL